MLWEPINRSPHRLKVQQVFQFYGTFRSKTRNVSCSTPLSSKAYDRHFFFSLHSDIFTFFSGIYLSHKLRLRLLQDGERLDVVRGCRRRKSEEDRLKKKKRVISLLPASVRTFRGWVGYKAGN